MSNKKDSGFFIEAIVLAAVLVLALPLRTVQYYSVIEAGTGFFTKVTPMVIIFFVIVAAAAIYFMVSAFMKRKKFALEENTSRKTGLGIISAVCGISTGFSAYQEYAFKDVDASKYTVTATISTSASKGLLYLQIIFAILAAAYFILLAISFFTGKSGSEYKLLSLAPVIWMVLRLVVRFTRTVSYIRVSDLLIEMLMLVMFSLFFMAFAQTNSMVNGEGNEWRLAAFGLSGALLGLICFVPRFILTITGHSDAMYALSRADVSDFAMSLFALITVLTRLVPKQNIIEETTESENSVK